MFMLIEKCPVHLGATWFHHTLLDGQWWPRSSDPAVELPGLATALGGNHGPVVRFYLSAAGWSARPHHLTVAGREVSIGYFAGQSPELLTAVRADGHTATLVVTSPN